jgi:hypothetical protein
MARFDEPIALRERPPVLARLFRLAVIVGLSFGLGIAGLALIVAVSAQR